MKASTNLGVTVLVLSAVASAIPGFAAPGDVEYSTEAPCGHPAGIACDGQRMFVADWRSGMIFQTDIKTCDTVESFPAPTLKPHGLALGGGKLWVCDDHTGWVYCVDPQTRIVENAFEAPGSRATGLAYADGFLYILERKSRKIYKVLPEDGTILANIPVPDKNCTCLTYDGKYLWTVNRIADEIYMVDPETGTVIAVLDAPGPYAAGVEWIDGRLWNVDFQTRKLYRITLRDSPMYRLSDTRRATVEYEWVMNNYGPNRAFDLRVNMAVPEDLPNQKLLSEVRFSSEPSGIVRDRWNQTCALFELGSVDSGAKTGLTLSVEAEVSAIRYLIIPELTGTLDDIPDDIRKAYTADGERYRIDSPYIKELAARIVGDEKNPYWIARKVFDHIIDRLHYEMIGGWDVPEVVLKRGSGSCSEYTFCFVALCRAAGLPARYQGSIVVRGDDASIDEAFHRWAQVYLPGYGWIPVDANRGDSKSPVTQAKGFGELAGKFLITTQSGGDSEHLRWGYNAHITYKTTGYCKIEQDAIGYFRPLGEKQSEGSE